MGIRSSKVVEIECVVRRQTNKAYLIDFGANEDVWVPRSQISDESEPGSDGVMSIFIPEWLAIDKGIL